MKKLPSLALVIPSFNRAHLIVETLKCALEQDTLFDEIIVVDDGSTDNTLAILETYSDQIRIIPTTNHGVQAARNTGVQASQCAYICLCDSDDLLERNYVTTVRTWLSSKCPQDILYCNFRTFSETVTQEDKFSQAPDGFFQAGTRTDSFIYNIPKLYRQVVTFQPLFSSGVVIKKDFYQRIGGYSTAFRGTPAEDFEFVLRTIDLGNITVCTDPIVRIRKHPGNDSRDTMKQCMGEASILEYALLHHQSAEYEQDLIRASIDRRRIDAFNMAFSRREHQLALELLASIQKRPDDLKFIIKKKILQLPVFARELALSIVLR